MRTRKLTHAHMHTLTNRVFTTGYELVLGFVFLMVFPVLWRRIRPTGPGCADWTERFGCYAAGRPVPAGTTIWIQAVSVGELLAIPGLIRLLRERYPSEEIILTVTTTSGRTVAARTFPDLPLFFFPFDFSFAVRAAFRRFNPKLIVLVETEVWPNLLSYAAKRNVPVVLVNGRISPGSFRWYRIFRWFVRRSFSLVTAAGMRSYEEAGRAACLGLARDRITVTGSVKFDQAYEHAQLLDPEEVRRRFGISSGRRVVVFGSLHPGEEEGVVAVMGRLRREFPDALFVLVPRWLNRTSLPALLARGGVPFGRRSAFPEGREAGVWLLDTYGELNFTYAVCAAAFVGGSLVKLGGQNPIEPAVFGKPVLSGPHMWHFAGEWDKLTVAGGGIEVTGYDDLGERIAELLNDPSGAAGAGRKAREVVLENRGAAARSLAMIERVVNVRRETESVSRDA